MSEDKPITVAELGAWGRYINDYFVEVLNGEKTIDTAAEDIKSFRGSQWYTGDDPEFVPLPSSPKEGDKK